MKVMSKKEKALDIINASNDLKLSPVNALKYKHTDEVDDKVIELVNVHVRDYILWTLLNDNDTVQMIQLACLLGTYALRDDVDDYTKASIIITETALLCIMQGLMSDEEKVGIKSDEIAYKLVEEQLNKADECEQISLSRLFRMMVDNKVPFKVFVDSIAALTEKDFEDIKIGE